MWPAGATAGAAGAGAAGGAADMRLVTVTVPTPMAMTAATTALMARRLTRRIIFPLRPFLTCSSSSRDCPRMVLPPNAAAKRTAGRLQRIIGTRRSVDSGPSEGGSHNRMVQACEAGVTR